MRKSSGDRGFSAAVQHRRASYIAPCLDGALHLTSWSNARCLLVCLQASGDFDNARAEKLHANLRNGRSPVKLSKHQLCSVYDIKTKKSEADTKSESMSAMSFASVAVTLTGSLFLISYAVVSTAIANANSQ